MKRCKTRDILTELTQVIDLTDYSRLPNGLLSMFASFSLAGARKVYVLTFLQQFVSA